MMCKVIQYSEHVWLSSKCSHTSIKVSYKIKIVLMDKVGYMEVTCFESFDTR